MRKLRIHRCCHCNKDAAWYYEPSCSGRRFYCDDCVPRGCTCNYEYVVYEGEPKDDNFIWHDKEHGIYETLDEKGRRYPCCEYDFSPVGQVFDDSIKVIKAHSILRCYDKSKKHLTDKIFCKDLENYIKELYNDADDEIDYNNFMKSIYDICCEHFDTEYILKFYRSFKDRCGKASYMQYLF